MPNIKQQNIWQISAVLKKNPLYLYFKTYPVQSLLGSCGGAQVNSAVDSSELLSIVGLPGTEKKQTFNWINENANFLI